MSKILRILYINTVHIALFGAILYLLYEISWVLWMRFPWTVEHFADNSIDYVCDLGLCFLMAGMSLGGSELILHLTHRMKNTPRTFLMTIAIFLFNLLTGSFITWIQVAFVHVEVSSRWTLQPILFNVFSLSSLSTIISLIYIVLKFTSEIRARDAHLSQLKNLHIQTQLDLLQAYLNPHFLFNGLSTISGLISDEPEKAETFVDHMSFILRYMLQNRNNPTVPMIEEIDNLRNYMLLMNIRFKNEINFQLEESLKDKSILICPGTLQLLVENAIKHNSHTTASPLNISVIDTPKEIMVINDYRPVANGFVPSFGVGQKNVETRFSILKKGDIRHTIENGQYIVSVPKIFVSHENYNY